MKLRLYAFLGLILAVAPSAALADPIYQFTNTTGGAVSRVDFAVVPAGSVQAPVIGTDPSTGLPRTTSPVAIEQSQSSGFDFNNFSTALGTGTNIQGLRLLFGQKQTIQNGQVVFTPVFGPNGEAPRFLDNGGTVTFALHLDPAFTGTVQLKSLTAGITDAKLLPPTDPGGGGTGGEGGGSGSGQPEIPEPATLGLWGGAALGMMLARSRRRATRRA